MEQHVEEITSCCQEYVIGGADKEPVRVLARGIRTSQYDLHKLVVGLGAYLTSLEEVRRARSTSLLSEVLGQLPEYQFTDGEVQHLITFYCDRLKDKVSVIPHVLLGLQVIILYQSISREQVVQISQAIFKELYVQSLPVMDRKMILTILSSFLTDHIEAVKIIGGDFVFGYIQAIDGEKDPRNLLIIFKSSLLVIHYLPIDNFVEDLYEVTACYFPIDFIPPANDPHQITRDDLVNSLRSVLCATPLFAELCLPLLMEKLSSDVHSAKIDSLLTLAAASEVYRKMILKHMEQVWAAIRNEVYQCVSQAVEDACHVAIRSITRSLSLVVTKNNSGLLKWVELILQDCQRHFSSPDLKLLPPTGQLLCSVAEGSESACHSILGVVLPLLVEQYKLHHQVTEKKMILTVTLSFLRVAQCLVPDIATSDTAMDVTGDTVGDTVTPVMTHRDDILTVLLTALNNAHSSLRAIALTGLVGLLALNGILSTEQVLLCSDHMIRLALYDLEEGLRKESKLAVSFISEHYPVMFREKLLPSLLDKIGIDQMDIDGDHQVDQSRVLRLLSVVSGHHNIANVTLPWLLNYLQTISATSYSDDMLENVTGVMDCIQSIVEHLSVLCDDGGDVEHFTPFLLDILKLFIEPTLNGDSIIDPHVLTDSTVLIKCAVLLRVGVQGVSSKMRLAVVKATKHTIWTLLESPDTSSFNPYDPASPWQQTQLISLLSSTISSFEASEVLKYFSQQLITCRNLACHTHHQLTCVHASKLYASIVNKLPAGDEMDYCMTVDMDYVWAHYHSAAAAGDVSMQIRAVTWWIWTTKALVIRSHPLGRPATVKLLSMFTSPDPVAKVASDGIYIILNEVPDLLNSKSHAIIKLMYRQYFFIETVPLLVEQLNTPENTHKQYYLRALSHVMQAVPKQVLLGELPSLLPMLVTSLDCPDEGLQQSTLDGIYALIFDAPDIVASYVTTLVPKLLHLAQQAPTMKVRIASLQSLGALSSLPAHQVLPYKSEVIHSLEACLDDKKRLVRKEAVKSRSSWFLLGAV